MATLTPVPVTLPEDKVPTKENIISILAVFLPLEWAHLPPSSLTMSYKINFTNAHCAVSRPPPKGSTSSPSTPKTLEPAKLFLKFHNSPTVNIQIFAPLVPTKPQEALLCQQYARTGYGAKVYGFFQTLDGTMGRIDEFLQATNLEPGDVEREDVRRDIARGLAAFHVTDLKTVLPNRGAGRYYDAVCKGLRKYHGSEKLKALGEEGGISIKELVDYDFASRLELVVHKSEEMGAREAWCIHDVQFMNTMLYTDPKEGESLVALIDFEFVMRNFRAFDIGGHFMQKGFKWFEEESRIADCRKYADEEKRHFCEVYVGEWNRRTGDRDTGEMVYREGELGFLAAVAFDVHNMLWAMDEFDEKNPLDLKGLNKLFEEFVVQYDRLGLEGP